jgi:hypothetical protein
VLDEERVYERHWDRPEQCAGHELAPIKHIATDQFCDDTDWHGTHCGFCQKDQRVQKFVLRQGPKAPSQCKGLPQLARINVEGCEWNKRLSSTDNDGRPLMDYCFSKQMNATRRRVSK